MDLKRTPLYQKHVDLGAKIVPFAGWEMPVSYPAGIIAEHLAVRSSAGLFDISHMGLIKIEGDDALKLIQKVATNDAAKLAVNQCQYSVLCNERGGAIDDVLVYRLPMSYLVIANASNTEKVFAWLKSFKPNSSLVDYYNNYCMLSIQGPKAFEVAGKILLAPLKEIKHNHTLWWKDIILSRTGYTGEDGLEMIVAKSEAPALWDSFIKEKVQPCGLGARDTLRLEAGLPLYGHEYDESTSPLEAGYSWAVRFDKGDFIGRETLLTGPKKTLVGLLPNGRAIPRQGTEVFLGGEKIGQVTSGTFSPTLSRPIALAYLTKKAEAVELEIRGQRFTAAVVDKTFLKSVLKIPANEEIRSLH